MAIAGASGWTPSIEARFVSGKLVLLGIAQNAPRELVFSATEPALTAGGKPGRAGDMFAAYRTLAAGGAVRVDVRWPNLLLLSEAIARLQGDPILASLVRAGVDTDLLLAAYGPIQCERMEDAND